MYKIAICDDDKNFCSTLEENILAFFAGNELECSLNSFYDLPSLNASIETGTEYDLIFLDILFDKDDGMSCAKRLRKQKRDFDIIFITTSKEYAVESFDVNPLYYILKPLDLSKLTFALNRFIDKTLPGSICVAASSGIIKLKLTEILYFEIYGHRIIVHKTDGTKSEFHGSLKDVEFKLPQTMFVRSHRSYIVNLNYVTKIARFDITVANGETIPISKVQYNNIQIKFLNFLDKKDLFI